MYFFTGACVCNESLYTCTITSVNNSIFVLGLYYLQIYTVFCNTNIV